MKKKVRIEKCPACGHDVEINSKTKVRRRERDYLRVECNLCGDIFPINRKEQKKDGQ